MRHLDRIELKGSHVHLEPLAFEHVEPLFRAATESRTTFGLTLVPDSLEAMRAYVTTLLGEQERGESLPFVVRLPDGLVVGATRYMNVEWWSWGSHPPAQPVPSGPDALEIGGTWYAERVQRTALNTEAKLLLCAHAFETLAVRRIAWKTDARNVRSRTAILRLGAQLDGVVRAQRAGADGTVRDSAVFSMLQTEWPAAKRELIAKLARGAAR